MKHRTSRRDREETGYTSAQERLASLERRLALHFQQTLLGVIEWDLEFRVNAWNPAAEAIFGYTRREALGRRARDLILPERVFGEVDAVWDNLLKLKGGQYNRNENVNRDGRIILCEWFNTPLVDSGGTVVGVMSLVQDITERRRMEEALRESENRYRTIFETTGAATLMIEENTVISLVNSEFERVTGYSREETEGKLSWAVLIPWEDERKRIMGYHRLRRTRPEAAPTRYEMQISDKHGRVREILVHVNLIPGTMRSIATGMDISDRKRDEAALRTASAELMSKTRELEEMNTALRVLLKQRQNDIDEIEKRLATSLKEHVLPHVAELKNCLTGPQELTHLRVIEAMIRDILAPYTERLSMQSSGLTAKQIRVADLIAQGLTTKEIARFLNLSRFAIDTHRAQLRKKLGLTHQKVNLRAYLSSMKKQ